MASSASRRKGGAGGQAYARALEEARRELGACRPDVVIRSAGAGFQSERDPAADRLAEVAERAASTRPACGSFALSMLGVPLRVTYPRGGVTAEGVPSDVGVAVVVLHYLARAAGPMDLADPVRFGGLSGATAFSAAFRARVEVPLLERFGDDEPGFASALRAAGGRSAEARWELPFLPYLPLGVRLRPAEDLLPAECVVLFPRRAGCLFPVEDLAEAGLLLTSRLLAVAGNASAEAPWRLPEPPDGFPEVEARSS